MNLTLLIYTVMPSNA